MTLSLAPSSVEVVVVGAGPAGAAAAYHLARRGREVLLVERERLPRDKICGESLTPSAVKLLDEMGVLSDLEVSWRVSGVRASMRDRESRILRYAACDREDATAHGLVVPRATLDAVVARRAVDAGAMLVEEATAERLICAGDAVRGVVVSIEGRQRQINARVVVAADGVNSSLARQMGLVQTPADRGGYALRAHFDRIVGLGDLVEFVMPLLEPTTESVLPSYGWAYPTGPTSANIGVGLFERQTGVDVRELFASFVRELRDRDLRFETARMCGPACGAPLRSDFAPDRCWASGLLVVGDAAGMISPFTGEGISYALESGKLAGELIAGRLEGRGPRSDDWSEYAAELRRRHSGYFETGRHATRHYRWVWRVLHSTFHSDQPLFALLRRGALAPEGLTGTGSEGPLYDVGPPVVDELRLRPELITVSELLADAMRAEWPFLARLYATTAPRTTLALRPAVLVLIASRTGRPVNANPARVAAAMELAALAAFAQTSVGQERSPQADRSQTNWGNMFAVMVADVLLARSLALAAGEGGDLARGLACCLEELCVGRARELRSVEHTARSDEDQLAIMAGSGWAAMFAAACELGATIGAASPTEMAAVTCCARNLGLAYQLLEDASRFDGGEDHLGRGAAADLEAGVPSFPVWAARARGGSVGRRLEGLISAPDAGPRAGADDLMVELVRECGVLDQTRAHALRHLERAMGALEPLPAGGQRQMLARFCEHLIDRARR